LIVHIHNQKQLKLLAQEIPQEQKIDEKVLAGTFNIGT